METDYLIIGGGLAGCTCAYLLAKEQKSVCVIEKLDSATKFKLCGGMLTPRALKSLEQIFDDKPEDLFLQSFDSINFLTEAHSVKASNVSVRTLIRKDLDDFVLDEAKGAGAYVLDKTEMRDIDLDQRRAIGFSEDSDTVVDIKFGALIVADGALSSTRMALTGQTTDSILTLEAEVQASSDEITMAFGESLKGYFWYIPHGSNAYIGCASYGGCDSLDDELQTFAQKMGVSYKTRRGAFMPAGSNILLQSNGVYYLGDAAGLICPVSGEGIYYALESARRLSQALLTHSSYSALMAGKVKEITHQRKNVSLFYNRVFMDTALSLAKKTPYGSERAIKFALKHFAGFNGDE